jgi:hypothetical protein
MSCGGSKLDFGDRNLEIDLWLDSSLAVSFSFVSTFYHWVKWLSGGVTVARHIAMGFLFQVSLFGCWILHYKAMCIS